MNIPQEHQHVMPYLILVDALKFFQFMQTVFDAKERFMSMRDDETLMHGELMVGTSTIMFAESSTEYKPTPAGLFIYTDDADKTYKKALNEGAISVMEPVTMEYGRTSGVKDPFGNIWWITSVI